METVLVKIFAMALALSQVTTAPDAIKTGFDRTIEQPEVVRLLREGCRHMRKAFDIEDINLDELIVTALEDPQAVTGEVKAFRGINFGDLLLAYRQFCKDERVERSVVDLGDVIDFYNKAAADLPDHTGLKALRLPGASIVLDGKGQRFAEVFEENQRRVWLPVAEIPDHVQQAFIAAEDKRFFQHKGIDERGLIRAFVANLSNSGRPQGGSTITQQVVKNLLVGDNLTYERKIREMIVAARLERALSKDEILELYLNFAYLGRSSWGVEMAARSYFGKSAKDLTLPEGALLAGLTKGPNFYSPDRHPERARERLGYVLSRMQEEGKISADESTQALASLPQMIAYERPRRDLGYHFIDQVAAEAKSLARIEGITATSYTVSSTINVPLQRAVEEALQEGLWRYERNAGRLQFKSAEANLGKMVEHFEGDKGSVDKRPAWQRAVATARPPLYDVHWMPALVLEKPTGRSGGTLRVGLADGRIVRLSVDSGAVTSKLNLHDLVMVKLTEVNPRAKGDAGVRAELRIRPQVQGTVFVLENKTGRILAMAGGFSYPLSQLNRATQAQRQPGSSIKPLSYLAALGAGLQPNTLIEDKEITLPPIGSSRNRERDSWTPKNYDGRSGDTLTLRQALENSRNLATVHLLMGGIESKPEASLDRLCSLALEAQIYRECVRFYPFVLGAQPVRPIDLAAFYATIANEGKRPMPHAVETISRNGQTIFRHEAKSATVNSIDRAAFHQLKTMLQGVLARGTARSIASLAPYVAGKTGTSDDANDVWFVGFTNDVTVAVWLGYDNADGKRRTLGSGATGGGLAVPIFEQVVQATWIHVAPKVALAPPSPEARSQLSCKSVDYDSGKFRAKGIPECLRVDPRGKIIDTQNRLISRESAYARRGRSEGHRNRSEQASVDERRPRQRAGWGYDDWWAWRRWEPNYWERRW
jgi:1A family penicillin-binding protein